MIYIILFSSTARCILPKHRVVLHLPIILVFMFLPWTDFFLSLWCQPPFLCWWYSYICLWFLTAFLFLCLAGIKSLMFQNHIQLKVCKTEFLVMNSLKPETTQLSLSLCFLPLLTSNFTSNRYPVGYLWFIIVFPDLICMETCLLSWKPW